MYINPKFLVDVERLNWHIVPEGYCNVFFEGAIYRITIEHAEALKAQEQLQQSQVLLPPGSFAPPGTTIH